MSIIRDVVEPGVTGESSASTDVPTGVAALGAAGLGKGLYCDWL